MVTKKIDTTGMTDNTFDSNSIYSLFVGQRYNGSGGPGPATFCNESFHSFVLCNIPVVSKLKTYNNDSDNLTDYQELYETFTNPFVSDTDADGVDDYVEFLGSSNPNNYSDYVKKLSCLSKYWNFVSLPDDNSVNKAALVIKVDEYYHNWSDAVSKGYVNDYIFGWNRIDQTYTFNDTLDHGRGYWIYAYEPCEIWGEFIDSISDGIITNLKEKWNVCGIPCDQNVDKSDLLVNDISWSDAVNTGLVSDFIFGWDRAGQYYNFASILIPGYAYWIYSYNNYVLKIDDSKGGGNDTTDDSIIWQVELNITETSDNLSSIVYFGESPDALDGSPADNLDAPAPPPSPEPYLRSYFDDNISTPYTNLTKDYRRWADTEKTWNLSILYRPGDANGTTVNISWNTTTLDESEYETVQLYDEDANTTIDMLIQSYYQYNATANTTYSFQILCSNGTLPIIKNVTNTPDTIGFGMNMTITADVTDEDGISLVKVNITQPDNTTGNYTMSNTGGDTYQYVFNDTWLVGTYNYFIWVNDTTGNSSYTKQYEFNVSANATISVCTVKNAYGEKEWINVTDPPGSGLLKTVGWELLDNNSVLRIWNTYDFYYFNTSNGIQLTNHYDEYWSHNVLMLGYYDNDQWNLIYRTDNLSGFNHDIDTDNTTYVNVTLWKDLNYSGYDFRLAIRYHLGVDDNDLTVIPYIRNLGDAIPYDLGFAWEINDIQVDMTPADDYVYINNSYYMLNETLDLEFVGMGESWSFFEIRENMSGNRMETLYLTWNNNLNYKVKVKSRTGQYNAPVILGIKIGTLAVNQSKQTELHWYDSSQVSYYFDDYDTSEGWETNPDKMVDIFSHTNAETTIDGDVELCNHSQCNGSDLGLISKVEIRIKGYYANAEADILLRPVFNGSEDGSDYVFDLGERPIYSQWFDITDDGSAPSTWSWDDVQYLDLDVESNYSSGSPTIYGKLPMIRHVYV